MTLLRVLAVLASLVLTGCATGQPRPATGLNASASARGTLQLVTGGDPYDASHTTGGDGTIDIRVTNVGDRWSQLQNTDLVDVKASLTIGGDKYDVVIDRAMPRHPMGSYTTWFGVAFEQSQHGDTGIGTARLPRVTPEISLWGWARVTRNGQVLSAAAPAHVMVIKDGTLKGVMLTVADEDRSLVGTPDGYLVAMWPEIGALAMPEREQLLRKLLGLGVLAALFIAFVWLAMTEPPAAPRRAAPRAA
jgi:hypothetical protein